MTSNPNCILHPRWFACLALLVCLVALSVVVWAAEPERRSSPAATHPRVLFSADDLPAIRARAATPAGQALLRSLQWRADHVCRGAMDQLRQGAASTPSLGGQVVEGAFNHTVCWLATGDAAARSNALEMTDFWLRKTPRQYDDWRQGHQLALVYDLLYAEMPDDLRGELRDFLGSRITPERSRNMREKGYCMGPVPCGRPCDWGALIAGSAAMQWLAIEGEDPRATPQVLDEITTLAKYVLDFGVSSEGQLLAGNLYAAIDLDTLGYALHAFQRRGISLVDHPHVQRFPVWMAYETLPGLYHMDNRNFSSGDHMGNSSMLTTAAARHGGVARWLLDQARGPDRADSMGVPALLYGPNLAERVPPPKLPLAFWSSCIGTVFSRSGWETGSYFCVTMEPPGGGKVHSDKGSFTFYSHGLRLAADAGVLFFGSEGHNTILIDGRGQSPGGPSFNDAIVWATLFSGIGDFTHIDVQPAYQYRLEYTVTGTNKVDWTQLEYGRGLPFHWVTNSPVQRADRFTVYVRGNVQPYVIVADDIQKDDQPHRYEWLLHTPLEGEVIENRRAVFQSRYGGDFLRSEGGAGRASFVGLAEQAGDYSVFALMRKRPGIQNFFSHTVTGTVNGRTDPYFRLGEYLDDWRWCLVGTNQLAAGTNRVEITSSARGAWVAQIVATPGTNAAPAQAVRPATLPGRVLFSPAATNPSWSTGHCTRPQLDVYFLQPRPVPAAGTNDLTLAIRATTKDKRVTPALVAKQTTVRAGFAALLLPHDEQDPTPRLEMDGGGGARLAWGPHEDFIYANPSGNGSPGSGHLVTDGKLALVRMTNGKVAGYFLVSGNRLEFNGKSLFQSAQGPVHAMNDGTQLAVQAPPGAQMEALSLGADAAVCNRETVRMDRADDGKQKFQAPVRPPKWEITFSKDQTVVRIDGDGPRPLRVHAPKAIDCVVNGVSVWFSREAGGYLYPKLDLTVPTHGPDPVEKKPTEKTAKE